jgi:hypothetical protein
VLVGPADDPVVSPGPFGAGTSWAPIDCNNTHKSGGLTRCMTASFMRRSSSCSRHPIVNLAQETLRGPLVSRDLQRSVESTDVVYGLAPLFERGVVM